jgi:hypothetical protein
MHRKLTAVAALAALAAIAATLAAVAAAGPAATKQLVTIRVKDLASGSSSFVLTPSSPGAIKPDSGTASFCCWTQRSTVRNGQSVDINNPQMTLTGKLGTIVARNVIGFVDIPDSWSVFTGTWKVIRGTGAYAGLAGGGGGAGVMLADGKTKAQFEGYLAGS